MSRRPGDRRALAGHDADAPVRRTALGAGIHHRALELDGPGTGADLRQGRPGARAHAGYPMTPEAGALAFEIAFPRAASPGIVVTACVAASDRTYATMVPAWLSERLLAGIAVPGIPPLMIRISSSSVDALRNCPCAEIRTAHLVALEAVTGDAVRLVTNPRLVPSRLARGIAARMQARRSRSRRSRSRRSSVRREWRSSRDADDTQSRRLDDNQRL